MKIVLALRQADARLVLAWALSDEPGVTVVGTASETAGLLALTQTAQPDLMLVAWDLPGRPLPEVLATARSRPPDSRRGAGT
jgi:DNA-binding NarL/FixJ family response regulator